MEDRLELTVPSVNASENSLTTSLRLQQTCDWNQQSFSCYMQSRRNINLLNRKTSNQSLFGQLGGMVTQRILEAAISDSDEWEVSRKMPALIKALRPEREYYHMAMYTFLCQENAYVLHEGNGWGFADMPVGALWGIRKIKICLNDKLCPHQMIGWSPADEKAPDAASIPSFFYRSSFASFTFQKLESTLSTIMIDSVILHCDHSNQNVVDWYLQNFVYLVAGAGKLKEVRVLFPAPSAEAMARYNLLPELDGVSHVNSPGREQSRVIAGIDKANELLGTPAKLIHVYAGDAIHDVKAAASYAVFDEYVWFAMGSLTAELNEVPTLPLAGIHEECSTVPLREVVEASDMNDMEDAGFIPVDTDDSCSSESENSDLCEDTPMTDEDTW